MKNRNVRIQPAFVFRFSSTLAILGWVSPSLAQNPETFAPYPSTVSSDQKQVMLGGWLEGRFKPMVANCAQWDGIVKRRLSKDAPASVVPIRLVDLYSLNRKNSNSGDQVITKVYNLGAQSVPALFAAVLTNLPTAQDMTGVISGPLPPAGPSRSVLNYTNISPNLQIVDPHHDGATYNSSCSSAISLAATLEGGYAMPMAAVKTALNGSSTSTSNVQLRMVTGLFYSPFAAMWNGKFSSKAPASTNLVSSGISEDSIDPLKTYAALIFWNWYADNSLLVGKNNAILEYFSGIAAQQVTESETINQAEASANFNASLPMFSANASSKGSTRSRNDFWSRSYWLSAYADGSQAHAGSQYMPLPLPQEIIEHFATQSLMHHRGSDDITIYNQDPVIFTQYVRGVVSPYCAKGAWSLKGLDGISSKPNFLDFLGMSDLADPQLPNTCVASFKYTPSASELSSGAAIEFALVSSRPVASGSLVLKGSTVQLKSYGQPSWRVIGAIPWPTDPSNISRVVAPDWVPTSLQWELQYEFVRGSANIRPDKGSASISVTDVVCTNSLRPLYTISSGSAEITDRVGFGPVLVVKLNSGVQSGDAVTAQANSPKCQVTANVRFKLEGKNQYVDVPLSGGQILYPLKTVSATQAAREASNR